MPLTPCSSPSYTPKAVFWGAVFPQALMSLSWLPLLLATGLEKKSSKAKGARKNAKPGPKRQQPGKGVTAVQLVGRNKLAALAWKKKMLSSLSVAGRSARLSLRVWGSVDGSSCRAEPRGRGVFNMGLGKLEDQGPRSSVRHTATEKERRRPPAQEAPCTTAPPKPQEAAPLRRS